MVRMNFIFISPIKMAISNQVLSLRVISSPEPKAGFRAHVYVIYAIPLLCGCLLFALLTYFLCMLLI